MADGESTVNDWVPGAGLGMVGLLGSLASWVFGWRETSARAEERNQAAAQAAQQAARRAISEADNLSNSMKEDFRELRDEFRGGIAEMRSAATSVAQLQASQQVVNAVTAKAIESITARQDRFDEKLNDHTATLKLVTELVTRERRDARA